MKIILLILIFIIISYFEIVPLIRGHNKKETAACTTLLLLSLFISLLVLKDVKIPSPSRAIERVVSVIIKR